jgi:hypothetical protein
LALLLVTTIKASTSAAVLHSLLRKSLHSLQRAGHLLSTTQSGWRWSKNQCRVHLESAVWTVIYDIESIPPQVMELNQLIIHKCQEWLLPDNFYRERTVPPRNLAVWVWRSNKLIQPVKKEQGEDKVYSACSRSTWSSCSNPIAD